MTLGNSGNLNGLVWLLCDLHPHNKTIVRHGWRKGLPSEKAPIWVFCPLLRANFPRDRELIVNCEKCSHFKGSRFPTSEEEDGSRKKVNTTTSKKDVRSMKRVFSKEELEKAEQFSNIEDQKWLDEEKKLKG